MTHRWTIAGIVTLAALVTAVSSAHSTDLHQDNAPRTHYGGPVQNTRYNHAAPTSGGTAAKAVFHSADVQDTTGCPTQDLRILWLHRLSTPQYCRPSQHVP